MKLCKSLFCEQLPCIDVFEMNTIFQASSLLGSVATLQGTGGQNTGAGGQSQIREAEAPKRNSERESVSYERPGS